MNNIGKGWWKCIFLEKRLCKREAPQMLGILLSMSRVVFGEENFLIPSALLYALQIALPPTIMPQGTVDPKSNMRDEVGICTGREN
ncbi:UNVERIFIED_CONTAM: hypothetical protein K2H54_050164, partial [Gekko kuhli]